MAADPLHVLGHDVNLDHLFVVVEFQRREIRFGEIAFSWLKTIVIAGRKTARPLLSRITSCSCSQSSARSRAWVVPWLPP